MSMEFFCWKYLDYFYGAQTKKAKLQHLTDALIFLPYGTMVDHFQHIVYENPSLTPAERNAEWLRLEKIYRPFMDASGVPGYGHGRPLAAPAPYLRISVLLYRLLSCADRCA